jgi:hypothetical protein
MAGPFARLRRGEGAQPDPGAPTEVSETVAPATAEPQALPTPDAPTAEAPAVDDTVVADPAAIETADPADLPADTLPGQPTSGFVERGRLRRRLRFVRRAREVALRDLGGLIFDLHRFGRERTDLVDQKLVALSTLDGEMRTLQIALDERQEVTVLREPGLASCPRCGALHASDAAYCSACGLPVGRGASLPTGPSLAGPLGQLPAGSGADAGAVRPEPTPAASGATTPVPSAAPDTTDPVEALTTHHAAGSGSEPVSRRTAGGDDAAQPAADEHPTTTS